MVETVGKYQGELKQAGTERDLVIKAASGVFVFEKGPPLCSVSAR